MKKDVWVCVECQKDYVCLEFGSQEGSAPPYACIRPDLDIPPAWQKTTDYEIVKKDPGEIKATIELAKTPGLPPNINIKEDLEKLYGAGSWIVSLLPLPDKIIRPTPNCSICEWSYTTDPQKLIMGPSRNGYPVCTAQGGRKLTSVYGNKICKRLFLKQIPPCPEMPENQTVKECEVPK